MCIEIDGRGVGAGESCLLVVNGGCLWKALERPLKFLRVSRDMREKQARLRRQERREVLLKCDLALFERAEGRSGVDKM